MHRRHLLLSLASATCLPACGGGDQGGSDGSGTAVPPAPADLLDLTHVTLTLPVKVDGTTGGTPARVLKTTELLPSSRAARGHESDWFRSVWIDGTGARGEAAVMLWCPVTGALSSATSDSPRTEFRHQRQTGVNDGWTIGAGSPVAMQLEMRPRQMPPQRGTVIVAQIHGWRMQDASGATVNAPPLLLVQIEPRSAGGWQLRAKIRRSADGSIAGHDSLVLQTFASLDEAPWLVLQMAVADMQVHINGQTMPIGASWRDIGAYYKAGVYLDEIGSDPAQGGRLLMRRMVFR